MNTKLALTLAALGCLTPAHGALLFYEGFDYAAGALDGNGGWTVASGSPQIALNGTTTDTYSGSYSGVTTTGGYMYDTDASLPHVYASVALGSSVTSTFTDGSVTWFSMINVRGTNGANARYGMGIGAGALAGGERWGTEMDGQGIGFTSYSNNATQAAIWIPNALGEDVISTAIDVPGGTGRDRFEVAKITWGVGAAVDTIEIAFFDAGVPMTEAAWNAASKSSLTANLDQSTFDTLSFSTDYTHFDEIRIASDFDSVISGTVVIPEPSAALLGGLGLLALLRRRRN